MSRNEISAGLEIIKATAEKSSLVLGSRQIDSFRKSVRLSLGKTVQLGDSQPSPVSEVELSWEFVEDLPARKEYKAALAGFLQSLSLRLTHPRPQQFLTLSGVPLEVEIHWPFRSIHTPDDSSVHVLVRVGSPWSKDANFTVVLSGVDKQEMGIPSLSPPVVERFVVNSIRIYVDKNRARFYPIGRYPENLQEIPMASSLFDRPTPSDAEVRDFIKRKVYWLGFREGDDKTLVATVDPYDLSYLARPARRLEQFARVLGAEQVIDLDASGQYAHWTDKLLREANAYEENLAGIIGKAEAENERTLLNEQVRQPGSESRPSVSVTPRSDDDKLLELSERAKGVARDEPNSPNAVMADVTNTAPALPAQPKAKHGPEAKMEFHRAVAEVVNSFGLNWKEHLEQIAAKLDKQKMTPAPSAWAKRERPARSWTRAVEYYPEVVVKVLDYSLKMAARDTTPGTFANSR
jgi:hypothetical protein